MKIRNSFEIPQLLDHGPYPDDWKYWPEPYREVAQKAVERKIAEHPDGVVVSERSECQRRGDLSMAPWQLRREITIEKDDEPAVE